MIISFETSANYNAKPTEKSSLNISRQRVNLKKKLIRLGYEFVDFDGCDDVGVDYFNVIDSKVDDFAQLIDCSSTSVTKFTIN